MRAITTQSCHRAIASSLVCLCAWLGEGCSGSLGENTNARGGTNQGGGAGTTGAGAGGGVGGSGAGAGAGGGAGGSGTAGGSAGSGGAGGAGGGGAGTAGAGGSGGGTVGVPCVPGIPSTSQVARLKNAHYDAVVNDLLGVSVLATAGNAPPSSLLAPDSAGSLTNIAWNGYLTAAEKIAAEVMAGPNKSKFIACDPAVGTCLNDTIKSFGRKVFRRPLTDAEVTSFVRLNSLTPKGTPAEVAEAILYAFLSSPSFITVPELAQDKEGTALKLSSYELAARLSFLLWGTIPDDPLNAAADGGQLTTKDQIAAQARRMLTSPKAAAVVRSFHQYYAGMEPGSHWVNNSDHDTTKFPAYSAAAYPPMMAEIDAFFQDVVLSGGKFSDLFLSNVAFVTKDTAPLYGLDPARYTAQATRVQLSADQRPGFLTRAGFLSTFSKFDATSPILRGAFISGRVLGINPGTPDPAATKMMPPPGNYMTQRQAIEALTANDPCRACHAVTINPPGFVLERYNSVGMWQDKDGLGGAIDGTATVRFGAAVSKTVGTPLEMMTEIANLPEVQSNYTVQWVAFASGRTPNPNDGCIVNQLSVNLANASYPVVNLIADYTATDAFRLRTVGN
ncbi:MAG TPA: DUF1592 domain-containing protein [Polyangiaceae bacterium]|nr:DUF1592 domain-containing protein [Polyangiaceae bacterium]